jgi:hypothetical protein
MAIPGTIASPEGASIIELRGWITGLKDFEAGVHQDNYHGTQIYDWGYDVELDPVWIDQIGSDLNQLMRVGSILRAMDPTFSSDHFTSVSRPIIHVEPMSSPRNDQPEGWVHVEPDSYFWLWNPRYASDRADHILNVGDYIRMVGNLVSDDPHWGSGDSYGLVSKSWGDDITIFGLNPKENPNNPSRWTELHPPDRFEILNPSNQPKAPTETVRCLALYADNGFLDGDIKQLDLDIHPSGPKPYDPWGSPDPRATVECIEIVDSRPHMTNFRRIMAKNITYFTDHVHLHVKIKGEGGWGAPGKFKAVYRVRWKPGKYEVQAGITPSPTVIQPGTPLSITITAIDPYNHQQLAGQALINNDPQPYPTNNSFNYTFHGKHQVVQVKNIPGYPIAMFSFDLYLKNIVVRVTPESVPLDTLITVAVYANDPDTNFPVDARVLISGNKIGPSDPQMPPDGFPTNIPFNFIFRRGFGSSSINGVVRHPDYVGSWITFWPPKTKEEKDGKEKEEKEEKDGKESMKEKEEFRDTIREEFYHLRKNTHQEDRNQNNAIGSGQHFITPDERPPVGEKKKNNNRQ